MVLVWCGSFNNLFFCLSILSDCPRPKPALRSESDSPHGSQEADEGPGRCAATRWRARSVRRRFTPFSWVGSGPGSSEFRTIQPARPFRLSSSWHSNADADRLALLQEEGGGQPGRIPRQFPCAQPGATLQPSRQGHGTWLRPMAALPSIESARASIFIAFGQEAARICC